MPQAPAHVLAAARRLDLEPEKLSDDQFVLRGSMAVPENRAQPAARTTDIHFVVIPSRVKPSLPAHFELAGGPGRAASAGATYFASAEGADYSADCDIVLVDQRGTGRSNPLVCDIGLYREHPFAPEYPLEKVAECRDALLERADLTCYGTADFIADLEDVRRRLDYEQIDLFAMSYGTRAALAYMRAHPASIRSAVLSGVVPPTARLRARDAQDSQLALEALLAECAADDGCRAAFGGLGARLEELLTRLREEPTLVELTDGRQVEARPGGFMALVRHLLYGPTSRSLPYALDAVTKGDWRPFLELGNPVGSSDEPLETRLAEGVYLSILCTEDLPYFDVEKAREEAARTWFGTERLDQALNAAQVWPRGEAPDWLREYPHGGHPILVINGGRDYVTPPGYGEDLARKLPNVTQVTIKQMGHSLPDGLSHAERFDQLVLHFLREQTVDGFALGGLDEMTMPPFRLGPDQPG
jgi:pimeloyl-ACP methyl ester carboxylesterase